MTKEIIDHLSWHILFSQLIHILHVFNDILLSLPVPDIPLKLPPHSTYISSSLLCESFGPLSVLILHVISAALNMNNHTVPLKILALLVFSDFTLQSFWSIHLNHIHLFLKYKYLLSFERYLPNIITFKRKLHTKLKKDSRSQYIIPILVRMAEN